MNAIATNLYYCFLFLIVLAYVSIKIILQNQQSSKEHYSGGVLDQLYSNNGPQDRYLTVDSGYGNYMYPPLFREFIWNNPTRYSLFPYYFYYNMYYDPYAI